MTTPQRSHPTDASNQRPSYRYRVVPSDPAGHIFHVTLTVDQPTAAGQVLTLPAWIPGSYMIRDFSKHIVQIQAHDDAGPVTLTKVDKRTWQAAPARGSLVVECDVYAWDRSVRKAHLDQRHGYFNGSSLFLCPQGSQQGPCELELDAPSDPACAGWSVATSLTRLAGSDWAFGRFLARDYDELIDHPVELGRFDRVGFVAAERQHDVALSGRHQGDLDRFARDLAVICQHHCDFWGVAPMDRYLFQLTVVDDGYGGLEHRASTSLISRRQDLPQPGVEKVSEGYRGLLGLCSHEYFHTWNIKRLKPAAFLPYDLSHETQTTLLWAFEGITSYYDDLALARTALIDTDSYLELLGRSLTRVTKLPGQDVQSLADSSFDTWIKLYQPDENSPNATVSYYTKGALVALALDLKIRLETDGDKSLDDVMADLWQRYGAIGIGVPEVGVEIVAAEVTGIDLRSFFDLAIRSTDAPALTTQLSALLAEHGLRLHLRPGEGVEDKGGKAGTDDAPPVDLGATLRGSSGALKITWCRTGGAAHRAGMSAGDVVVAVDGLKASQAGLQRRLATADPGDPIDVIAFREDELMRFELTLQSPALTHAWLELSPDATDAQVQRRKRWLHSPA